jgi:hypothetical protein
MTRRRVADAAVAAEAEPAIRAVDVIPADADPTDRWTLDLLVVENDARPGVPRAVLAVLADHDLHLLRAGPQGPDYQQVIAVG